MRKVILIVISSLITIVASAGKNDIPNEFFGLKFGGKYTKEQLVEAMKNHGIYLRSDTEPYEISGVPCINHHFANVHYCGRVYNRAILSTTAYGDLFHNISFKLENSGYDYTALDSTYEVIKGELSEICELKNLRISNGNAPDMLAAYGSNASLCLQKIEWGGHIRLIMVIYTIQSRNFGAFLRASLPKVQDTFFDQKLGSKRSNKKICTAIGSSGVFMSETNTPYGKCLLFENVVFAGRRWDFCKFHLTDKNLLYRVTYEMAFRDAKEDSAEYQKAESLYADYKRQLDDKYGKRKGTATDDGARTMYYGGNKIAVTVSNEMSISVYGSYRRYVTLDYTLLPVYEQLLERPRDEL